MCTSNTPLYQQEGQLSSYPLSLVAIFRWTIPLAAWPYPVFLLCFVRTQPLLRGMMLVLLATVLVGEFALQGVIPNGRLSTVVCFDADFPGTLRQAGQAGADVMLVPSNDWPEIDPYHTQLTTFRAIEDGYSLVRQTSHGLAMTVDYEGNVLAASDYFTTDPQVMVAYVPMQGVHTIYATIGDLFAWLSLAGLVVLIGVAIARRRKAGEAGAAEPIKASPSEASPIEAVPTSSELTEPPPASREPISVQPSLGEPPEASPT